MNKEDLIKTLEAQIKEETELLGQWLVETRETGIPEIDAARTLQIETLTELIKIDEKTLAYIKQIA